VGAVELIRRVAPGLHVHGSTQMTITSAEGAQFAAERGVSRVVVGRELSIEEIGKARKNLGARTRGSSGSRPRSAAAHCGRRLPARAAALV
jgi:collagenase-like PrtC family protease